MPSHSNIVVLGDYEQALTRLVDWASFENKAKVTIYSKPLAASEVFDAIKKAHVIVLVRDRTPMSSELLRRLTNLRYLIFTGTRNNTLDLSTLFQQGIPVSNTQWGPSKESTCEMTWALILAARRRILQHAQQLRDGAWRSEAIEPLDDILFGKTLGVIGLGEIGARVAKVGKAFGMKLLVWSPNMTQERADQHQGQLVPLDQLLEHSQIVTLHLVVGSTTRQLLNAQRLALMAPDSVLVNTSRAGLIDSTAIAGALAAGRPGYIALDVFDTEPLPQDTPLNGLPNMLLTPHLGFVTEPVFRQFAAGVSLCLRHWLEDLPLANLLEKPT